MNRPIVGLKWEAGIFILLFVLSVSGCGGGRQNSNVVGAGAPGVGPAGAPPGPAGVPPGPVAGVNGDVVCREFSLKDHQTGEVIDTIEAGKNGVIIGLYENRGGVAYNAVQAEFFDGNISLQRTRMPLAPHGRSGQSYIHAFSEPGPHVIRFVLDGNNLLGQASSIERQIQVTPRPGGVARMLDCLQVTFIPEGLFEQRTAIDFGQRGNIAGYIRNTSDNPNLRCRVQLKVDGRTIKDTGEGAVMLQAHDTVRVEEPAPELAVGGHTLTVVLDPDNTLGQYAALSRPLRVNAAPIPVIRPVNPVQQIVPIDIRADARACSISFAPSGSYAGTSEVYIGQSGTIYAECRNDSNIDLPFVLVKINVDGRTVKEEVVRIGPGAVIRPQADGVRFTGTGLHKITLVVDADDRIEEKLENNNSFSSTVNVLPGSAPARRRIRQEPTRTDEAPLGGLISVLGTVGSYVPTSTGSTPTVTPTVVSPSVDTSSRTLTSAVGSDE